MAYAMVILRPVSRRRKILRTIMMGLGISLLWYANYFVMYGGEDTASISGWAAMIVLIVPLMIEIWYIADCFAIKRVNRNAKGRSHHGLLDALCWPLLIGGLLWTMYVLAPRIRGETTSTATTYWQEQDVL